MFVQKVALNDVKFFAFHGFYPEEQLLGSHFLVDAEVEFTPRGDSENIDDTVNYEAINEILIQQMQQTQKMLETVVKNIMNDILVRNPKLLRVTVGIRKLNPIMKGEVGKSFVQLCYNSA